VPGIYANRACAEASGLMSYGSNWTDSLCQAGIYCGRIFKGAKPADLPVQQQIKFHSDNNLKAAEDG
jgi:putative ABC transport system substrate-binding protein